jgi:hypothetical protein
MYGFLIRDEKAEDSREYQLRLRINFMEKYKTFSDQFSRALIVTDKNIF